MTRRFVQKLMLLFSIFGGALLLGSCDVSPTQLKVKEARVQLSPVDGNPSAAYFNVYGGYEDVELLAVTAPSALRLEIHETIQKDGRSSMNKIVKVAIPAKGKVAFEPGGKHIMLWGINDRAREAGKIELEFVFSNNDRILVEAVLQNMGDAQAQGHQMGGDHDMGGASSKESGADVENAAENTQER